MNRLGLCSKTVSFGVPDRRRLGLQPGDNVSQLTNDAGYTTFSPWTVGDFNNCWGIFDGTGNPFRSDTGLTQDVTIAGVTLHFTNGLLTGVSSAGKDSCRIGPDRAAKSIPMKRVVEPELMTEAEQARAYAAADFEEAHRRYPLLFQELFPDCPATGHALDIGCGPGDVTRRFAALLPGWTFDAVDGSPAMLAQAPKSERIRYIEGRIPGVTLPRTRYDLILSSSLLHHLHEPAVLWDAIRQHAAGMVFVVDLRRPATRQAAEAIVVEQAAGETEILRRDFFNSLLAAFSIAEVREQLRAAGLTQLRARELGERHLVVWGRAG